MLSKSTYFSRKWNIYLQVESHRKFPDLYYRPPCGYTSNCKRPVTPLIEKYIGGGRARVRGFLNGGGQQIKCFWFVSSLYQGLSCKNKKSNAKHRVSLPKWVMSEVGWG